MPCLSEAKRECHWRRQILPLSQFTLIYSLSSVPHARLLNFKFLFYLFFLQTLKVSKSMSESISASGVLLFFLFLLFSITPSVSPVRRSSYTQNFWHTYSEDIFEFFVLSRIFCLWILSNLFQICLILIFNLFFVLDKTFFRKGSLPKNKINLVY